MLHTFSEGMPGRCFYSRPINRRNSIEGCSVDYEIYKDNTMLTSYSDRGPLYGMLGGY